MNDALQGTIWRAKSLHRLPWTVRVSDAVATVMDADEQVVEPLSAIKLGNYEASASGGSPTLMNTETHSNILRALVGALNETAEVHELRPEETIGPDYGSEEHVRRVTEDWRRWAKDENIRVEYLGGAYYGFGSEVSCLRLFAVYRKPHKSQVAFSSNAKSWFFRLEVD